MAATIAINNQLLQNGGNTVIAICAPCSFQTPSLFAAMTLVLVVRPHGLLGVQGRE